MLHTLNWIIFKPLWSASAYEQTPERFVLKLTGIHDSLLLDKRPRSGWRKAAPKHDAATTIINAQMHDDSYINTLNIVAIGWRIIVIFLTITAPDKCFIPRMSKQLRYFY